VPKFDVWKTSPLIGFQNKINQDNLGIVLPQGFKVLLKHYKRPTGFTGPAIKQVGSPHLASLDSIPKLKD